ASAFRVAGGDDGRMLVEITFVVEKFVNRVSNAVADSEYSRKSLRAHPEVRILAQKFHGLLLRLHRVNFEIGFAQNLHAVGEQLITLSRALRLHQLAAGFDAGVKTDFFQNGFVRIFKIHHHLEGFKIGAVEKRHETVVAKSAHPAAHGDFLVQVFAGKHIGYFYTIEHTLEITSNECG